MATGACGVQRKEKGTLLTFVVCRQQPLESVVQKVTGGGVTLHEVLPGEETQCFSWVKC